MEMKPIKFRILMIAKQNIICHTFVTTKFLIYVSYSTQNINSLIMIKLIVSSYEFQSLHTLCLL